MRRLIAIVAALAATLLATPVAADASSRAPVNAPAEVPPMLFAVASNTVKPPGFTIDASQAIAIAKATAKMQAIHRREHPLQIFARVWFGSANHYWYIGFSYHGTVVANVNVSASGRLESIWTGPEAVAPYARGSYATLFGHWWVLVPFSLAFLLPFLDPRRLRRMAHLDALVLLSFLISYGLFAHAHLVSGVWLAYPPLLYLLLRMLRIGFAGGAVEERVAPLLPTWVLIGGLLLLVGGRIALSLLNTNVIDVGYASVLGAHRIIHHQPLYYANAAHGDTYGPINYLAYVPFVLVFPWHGVWDYLPSAHAASIAFDLITMGGLIALGSRFRKGRHGRRLGLVLAWTFAACPFTLLALIQHTNDGLIAMLSVLSLLVFSSPVARGVMLGLAAAAKFSPAALLPLYAGRDRRGLKGTLVCAVSFVVVVVLAIWLYLPPGGGLSEFYSHTLGFQLTRSDVFSPWALHPSLAPIKTSFEVMALLLAAAVAFIPRRRSLVQVCALAAAVTIAVQLPAVHWFYFYIVWFVPFMLVASLGEAPVAIAAASSLAELEAPQAARVDRSGEPALAGT